MDSEDLVLLTLDLDIPNLWENALVKKFPKATFAIKQANPLGDDSFSGLLEIKGVKLREVNKFLEDNYPLVTVDNFCKEANLFHYLAPDEILSKVVRESKSVLSWPVPLLENHKRVKFVIKGGKVNAVMDPLEADGIEIKKFSKVKVDFNLKEILTPKQKEILAPSLKHGYYSFPKKISLNALSKKIGVSPSTLCVHLQKIESKILNSEYQDLLFNF
jgi:hypothetical protein